MVRILTAPQLYYGTCYYTWQSTDGDRDYDQILAGETENEL